MHTAETPVHAGGRWSFARLDAVPGNRIADLFTDLTQLKEEQHDVRVNTKELAVTPSDGALMVGGNERYQLGEHAFGQLCSRLQVPAQYARRCDTDLRARNINRWLNEEGRDVLHRIEGGEVRAVLSFTCQPINHVEILKWLTDPLGGDVPALYELNETYFGLHMVRETPINSLDDRGRESLSWGPYLRNGEVGAARVETSTLVYHSTCLNGLIFSSSRGTATLACLNCPVESPALQSAPGDAPQPERRHINA